MKTKKEIALGAARLLREVGWVQGTFRTYDPDEGKYTGFCMLGAIRQTAEYFDRQLSDEEYDAMTEVVMAVKEALPCGLVSYNDTPGRTKDEVIAVLEKAAEGLQ